MKKSAVVLFFAVVFCAGQAKAADGQLSLYAGYLNQGGNLSLTTVSNGVTNTLHFRGSALYGARVEFDFHRVIGLEENLGFSPRLFDSGFTSPEPSADTRGLLYSTNLVLNIPLGRFVPYATGGVGFLKPWGSGLKPFDARFAGNYGGGLKLDRLIGPVGLRFDVRGWSVKNVFSHTLNMIEATGSVTFSWGGR
jgi:hypothetical protein